MLYVAFVEPKFSGNIGFIARVMANFEFENLILVNPGEIGEDAYRFAKHGRRIIENAIIMKNFDELRNFLDYAIATSGIDTKSPKKFKRIALTPEELADKIGKMSGKIGIIFGRENYGLYNNEIEKCDLLVKIPSSSKYPVLNVSHAAAIILYNIYRKNLESSDKYTAEDFELDLLTKNFSEILEMIDFPNYKRKNIEVMFRRIIGRATLTKWEFHSLMGLINRIKYKLKK